MHQVLLAAHKIFSCGMWTLSWDVVSWPEIEPGWASCIESTEANHWTTRKVPYSRFTFKLQLNFHIQIIWVEPSWNKEFETELCEGRNWYRWRRRAGGYGFLVPRDLPILTGGQRLYCNPETLGVPSREPPIPHTLVKAKTAGGMIWGVRNENFMCRQI